MRISWKSKSTRFFGLLGVIIIAAVLVWKFSFHGSTLPSFEVQQSEFLIPITTAGELRAVHSISITVPRARGYSVRITRLVPEGTTVKKGDFLVQFDTSEITETIHKRENALKNVNAELNKLKANIESTQKDLESQLEMQRYSYEQSKLQLKQMEFESEARKREEELSMKKADIALSQAKYKLQSQKAINKASLEKALLTVDQARSNLQMAQKSLKGMTILSPAAGMVVYNNIWGSSGRQKVKVGDMPWFGQAILEIPDLSKMFVKTKVNEVDIDRIRKGQPVIVTVDALPGVKLHGSVSKIATLAHKDRTTNTKVFNVDVTLDSTNRQLKPGMTANCKIITDRLEHVVFVPIESVFEKDGKTIVYVLTPKPKPREVVTGPKNDDYIVIKKGLTRGEKVSLWDPTQPFKELGREVPTETKPKPKKKGGVRRMIMMR